MSAEIEVLKQGWGLPEAAIPVVQRLVASWDKGHTAIKLLPGEVKALGKCKAVGPGTEPVPLVLAHGRLQSWRFWAAERDVASRLKSLAEARLPAPGPELEKALQELCKAGTLGEDQGKALALGLAKGLALVTGGPGTGKTHTAAYLLAARLQAQPLLRFALAAPTAKAARRLGSEIALLAGNLLPGLSQAGPGLKAAMDRALTLHKWLGYHPGTGLCRRNAEAPLDVDLVIVDEASMMDVLLWRALLQALPPAASLVVLGDPSQLESVEAGRVLGALVASASQGALKGCHASLNESFRFRKYPAIGALAQAVLQHDPAAVKAATPPPAEQPGATEGLRQPDLAKALDRVWPHVEALAEATEPGPALAALGILRILCAVNEGAWGVSGLNAAVEERLGREHAGQRWCQPLLVTENDLRTGLNNGDLGVLLPDGMAWFDRGDGLRCFALSNLPSHGLAWAMSIHKSQGSEYQQVLVLLPPASQLTDNTRELLGPELLYTAITRAKQRVVLCADVRAIGLACEERPARETGLESWLA